MNSSLSDERSEGRVRFTCSDVVAKNCGWQARGNSEEELMFLIKQHSREKHGFELDDETLNGVHHAIRKDAA